MQGTLQKQKCGYQWMRIGFAETKFSTTVLIMSLFAITFLAIWSFREIPDASWRWGKFIGIYLFAAILYMNIGVWLHEQLHCLAFRGTNARNQAHINFSRKYIVFLSGHYTVKGSIIYRTNRCALLAPLVLPVGLSVIGLIGRFFLPGWWLPVLLTMGVAGIIDMIHDFYMYLKIRGIGDKGKYWDTGKYLEVVWKE